MSEFSFMDGGHDAASFQGGHDHGGFGADHHGADGMGGPSHTAIWNPGVKGVKLSDMMQGINVTPNFMLAMLFIGMTAWLFVIYWIRHNEPLANQVLGSPTAGAPTASADRHIVAGARNALPIRTSQTSGTFYTPDKKWHAPAAPQSAASQNDGGLPSIGNPSQFSQQSREAFQPQASSAPIVGGSAAYGHHGHFAPPVAGNNHSRYLKGGREHIVVHHPEPMVMHPDTRYSSPAHPRSVLRSAGGPLDSNRFARRSASASSIPPEYGAPSRVAMPSQFPVSSPSTNAGGMVGYSGAQSNGHYHMPVSSDSGLKLKTVVNR